jgi:ribonuclease HII
MPDYSIELEIGGIVAGVDEAGRGPWAGPVVASAVVLDIARVPEGIDDSKKLPRDRREHLHGLIVATAHVGVGIATVEEIDRINILQATFLAMLRAVEALPVRPHHLLIDGNRCPKDAPCPARPVIGGDATSLSIAAASIIAKVTRDRIMAELATAHPHYGWERNAGYGTPEHQRALSMVGITPHHRKSFSPIYRLMDQDSPTSV